MSDQAANDEPSAPRRSSQQSLETEMLSILHQDSLLVRKIANCVNSLKNNANVQKKWKELTDNVSHLESNLEELHQVLREEQEGLRKLRALDQAAKERNQKLRDMVKQQQKQQHTELSTQTTLSRTPRKKPQPPPTPKHSSGKKQTRFFEDDEDDYSPANYNLSPSNLNSSRRNNSSEGSLIPRVTDAEFHSLPHPMRSHITLSAVNDAIRDMEQLLAEASKSGRRKHLSELHTEIQQQASSSPRNYRLENNKQEFRAWVTEQELRQFCSFFRLGESTARATLLILRNLQRLQQVPGKHGEFLYFVP